MPVFEVQGPDGKTYEVDAPDMNAAAAAFDQPKQEAPQYTSDQLNSMTAENARKMAGRTDMADYSQSEIDTKARGARAAESGAVEGVKTLWAGVKQLGAGVQDAYNLFVKGQASRSEDVVTGPDGERKRVTELLDSSKEKQVIAEEMMREQVDQEKARDAGVSIPQRSAAAGAVQMGALALGPELVAPKATTMVGSMLRNAGTGVGSNALTFDAEGGNIRDPMIAAGAPAILGMIPALAPAVKNYVGRAINRTLNAGRMDARMANFGAALPETAKTATLAQRTGIPELITLERASHNSTMVNHFADQTDKFVSEAVKGLRQPLKEGQTLSNDFVAAREKASENLKSFRIAASDNYAAGIKEARAIANKNGTGLDRIPMDNFQEAAGDIFNQVRGLKERGVQSDIFTKRFMDHTERLFQDAGRGTKNYVSTKELSNLMVDLTAMQKSENPVTRKFAGQLREKLDADLDVLEGKGSFQADDAAKTILETRAEYRRAHQLIGELEDSAAYKLLGVADRDVSPDVVLSKFKGFTPEKRGSIRNFLEENNPELLMTLKDAAVKEAQASAKTIRAGADSQNDLGQMVDAMFDPKGFDMRTSGLWNDTELKHIEGVKEGLRTIANHRPSVGPSGTPIKPEDLAINAVSQHPAFLARAAARVLMSVKGANFFTDPKVYERLRVINRSTTGPTNMIARAALLDYLNTNYLEQSEEDQQ